MSIPDRQTLKTGERGLRWLVTDDGSRTLQDDELDETYHSGCGAVAETFIVYLRNSGAGQRLVGGDATKVLEYGLGTGTACLLTAAWAEVHRTPLTFCSIEHRLLPSSLLADLDLVGAAKRYCEADPDGWFAEREASLVDRFLDSLGAVYGRFVDAAEGWASAATNQVLDMELGTHSKLSIWNGDARQLPESWRNGAFDAVYFDPFAPATNPELWCAEVYREAHGCLAVGGTLTSYCVKAVVRRELEKAGFEIDRLPGPKQGKREVLLGRKRQSESPV